MQSENNTNSPAGTSFVHSAKNYFDYRAFEGAAVFLLLFFYIVAMAILFSIRNTPLIGYETDGVTFMMKSRALFTKYFSPPTLGAGVGSVFAMRFFDMIVHDTFAAGKLVSMIAGFFYLLASFKVMKKLYAPSTGLLTALLLLVNPTVVIYSTISGSDMLAAAFLMMALWALLDNQRNSRVFLAGLCLGLGFTVRCVYIIFIILILSVMGDFKNNKLRTIYKFVIGSIGFIVGSLPQLAANVLYYGSPIFTNSWRLVALTLHEGVYDSGFLSLSFAKVNQQGWLRLCYLWMKRFVVQVPTIIVYAVFWPAFLAVPGYILSFRRFKQNNRLLILSGVSMIIYLFFLSSVFFENEPRYLLPVFPLLLASSMTMLRILVNDRKRGIVIGFTVILLITVFATIEKTREYITGGQAMEFKKAGLFLNAKAGPHDIIVASQPHVFFYARRPGKLFESFSREELKNFEQDINTRGVQWVVFDERYGAGQFPSLTWLLDPESSRAAANGWHSVFDNKTKPRIVVWRVQ
ncbi:MAG: glycosyltransferase family 39 protein [Candidatus Omnitrophica bacterium]|nr:glycosyltransferase family 39 protein [Candidatus Omnitrophota bacterium]